MDKQSKRRRTSENEIWRPLECKHGILCLKLACTPAYCHELVLIGDLTRSFHLPDDLGLFAWPEWAVEPFTFALNGVHGRPLAQCARLKLP